MLHLDTAVQERLLGRTVCEVLTPGDRLRLRGQRALVTGAGGSVGSELSRQLASAGVARLTLMDHSEYALFLIESAIREAFPQVQIVPLLGDVSRRSDVSASCRVGEPHVVYHAAAYKHVTYAETAIVQALRVNALGAAEMARAAREAGARFVLISSDKAAEPRSVMGATKRFAEQVVLNEASGTFRPIVVRFGNVLASSGSVAEIMLTRARAGLPLPITDPRATRYFLTAAEAVSLVLKADVLGRRPDTFWLDMGKPVPIGDLAARIADLVRREGGPAVSTVVIGLRPGEKTHEELTSQGVSYGAPTRAQRAAAPGAACPRASGAQRRRSRLHPWKRAGRAARTDGARERLRAECGRPRQRLERAEKNAGERCVMPAE